MLNRYVPLVFQRYTEISQYLLLIQNQTIFFKTRIKQITCLKNVLGNKHNPTLHLRVFLQLYRLLPDAISPILLMHIIRFIFVVVLDASR